MKNIKITPIIFAFLCCLLTMQAQERNAYCSNQIADTPVTNAKHTNKVYATSVKNGNGIEIIINNTTKDTIYLFSSYLKDDYLKSKYLHRVDKKNKINKLSLLPLTPFVSTKYSDNIIMGEEAIINKNQIVYDFIVIPPNQSYKRLLSEDIMTVKEVTKDFDLADLNLNSRVKFKSKNLDRCKKLKSVMKTIEFAIYRDVNMLCEEKAYYTNVRDFDVASKNYDIIRISL
ncbi:hypothetical protein DFQ03_0133 [Maribacter caenipelagi]|uniref:DUF4384 domain-containing protein n=1 Tax=Maribacter caenipelagi TaxID=1447781 RepID=A0A4R7DI36_9FLAO|nr:hypothetical protein [Maribacter caenipelagi]TDS20877.1 hypothetical protein DFQ03_0133 [Maribacter caenipelagi]